MTCGGRRRGKTKGERRKRGQVTGDRLQPAIGEIV
jgi:hypothetical protein